MKSGISFMPSLISKSSLRGDITHNTFNNVKENIFTVGKHSRHLVTNICPRPVLPCWYCVGRLGKNNQLVLAGSATLMCGKPGILRLSIGIDYVCGSLCLWIDTIRLKWWGRKEARRCSSQLREWVCVREAHEKGEALWAPAAPFLITLTHLLSVQGKRETREHSSQAKVLRDSRIDGTYFNYGHFYFLGLIFFFNIHSFILLNQLSLYEGHIKLPWLTFTTFCYFSSTDFFLSQNETFNRKTWKSIINITIT